jgi:precorrin-4 methylase
MPLGTLRGLVERLLEASIGPDRPVTAVFNATRPDEHVVAGTVATIADRVEAEEVVGPCLVLIGTVLSHRAGARPEATALQRRADLSPAPRVPSAQVRSPASA